MSFTTPAGGNVYVADESTLHLAAGTFSIKAGGVADAQVGAGAAIAPAKLARYPQLKNGTTGIVASAGETVFAADAGYAISAFWMNADSFGGAQTFAYVITYSDATTYTSPATAAVNQSWAVWPNALIDNALIADDVMVALPTFTGKTITAIGDALGISRNHRIIWWVIEA